MARKLAVSPFVLHQSMPCFFLWLSLVGNYWHHWRWLCTGPPHSEMTSRINLWRWWCNQAEILAIPQNQIFNTLWFCLTFTYKTLPSMWCVFFCCCFVVDCFLLLSWFLSCFDTSVAPSGHNSWHNFPIPQVDYCVWIRKRALSLDHSLTR